MTEPPRPPSGGHPVVAILEATMMRVEERTRERIRELERAVSRIEHAPPAGRTG